MEAAIGVLRAFADVGMPVTSRILLDCYAFAVDAAGIVDIFQLQERCKMPAIKVMQHMLPFETNGLLQRGRMKRMDPRWKKEKRTTVWIIRPSRVYYAATARVRQLRRQVSENEQSTKLVWTPGTDAPPLVRCDSCGHAELDMLHFIVDDAEDVLCPKCKKLVTPDRPAAAASSSESALVAFNTVHRALQPSIDALYDVLETEFARARQKEEQKEFVAMGVSASSSSYSGPSDTSMPEWLGGVPTEPEPKRLKAAAASSSTSWLATPTATDAEMVPIDELESVRISIGGKSIGLSFVTQDMVNGMSESEMDMYERACQEHSADIEFI